MTDVDALVSRMTLDEKIAQLGCVWSTALVSQDAFSEDAAASLLANGIGEITRIGASTGLQPRGRAQLTNAIQRYLVEHTRLGIPAIVHEESTAGLCARDATQFPQAIGLAATWDTELVHQIGEVIREQMVATGARHTLAPVLDIARDPRWGRTEETYGESAYLASRIGVAYVCGVQGRLRDGVAATGKHFLGYGYSEGGMNHAPVHLGARELREVFAEPFRAAISEAGLATIMNSYASVDGLACGGSKAILEDLLRGELGFGGTVVADYFTTGLLISHHRVATTKPEAAARAISAGLDMELPHLDCYPSLAELVTGGVVDEGLVDRSVARVLRLKDALGLFDEPYVNEAAANSAYHRATDQALARRAAAESLVLLHNDGVLPLHDSARIAVIGPCADDVRLLQGDYSYPAHTEIVWKRDTGGGIAPASGSAFAAGPYYPDTVTPLAGIKARAAGTVAYAKGCGVRGTRRDDIANAVATAADADVAICIVGGRSGLMPDCTSGEFRDVTDLDLPGVQQELVEAVVATGTPTVVVVVSGRVHTLAWIAAHANALMYAWLPGEQGGAAIADVLFGDVAPSGRLPVTLPRHVGQVPIHHDFRAGGGRSQMLGDYVDAPSSPLFPFGFGLSYTTFTHENLYVETPTRTDAPIVVHVDVHNAGARAATGVVQLFVRDDAARVARPDRQLGGFARVDLEAGERRTVRFTIDPTLFAYYDEEMRLVVEPGAVRLFVGECEAVVTLEGPEREIRPNDRRATEVTVSA